jgi:hypothetical protein
MNRKRWMKKTNKQSMVEELFKRRANGIFTTAIVPVIKMYANIIFFLSENLMKKKYTWEPEVIACCIILLARWPGTYKYIRRSELLLLPSVSTLRSYIGKLTGDIGFTPIVEKKLISLAATLGEQEKEVSLEIDVMAIDPKMRKIKHWDRIVGQVNMGGVLVVQVGKPILAKRLLAFHMTHINGVYMSCCIFLRRAINSS